MGKTFYYLLLLLIMSGCTHRIVRTGYQVEKSDYRNCEIVIKKFMQATDSMQKVGEIKLGESGFSVSCSEGQAVEILKNEGCALNADIINIIEENRPDLWSTCYRCRAEFYKFEGSDNKVQSDVMYKSDNVKDRVSQDRSKNTALCIIGGILGFMFGYLLFL